MSDEIRAMEEEDVDDVLRIERTGFLTPWAREHFLYEICRNPHAANRVIRRERRVAAYACAWILAGELRINNVAVDPMWRRRGMASRLIGALIEEARAQGCTTAQLEVRASNRAARGLYESWGFRPVGRRVGYYRDSGEDAVLMERALV